jgi:hypothetical protein
MAGYVLNMVGNGAWVLDTLWYGTVLCSLYYLVLVRTQAGRKAAKGRNEGI